MANDELKNIVDTLVDKSKDVAKKAENYATNFIGNAKTRIEAEKIEYAINKKYRELGKAYYEAHSKGLTFDSKLITEEIDTLFDALGNLNIQQKAPKENQPEIKNVSQQPDDISKFFDEKKE